MQTRWTPTNQVYRAIADTPDEETREQLYEAHLIEPLLPWMEQRFFPMIGPQATGWDVAQMWGWLMPDKLTELPESLMRLEAADAWQRAADSLAESADRFAPFQDQIGIEEVIGLLILGDPARSHGSDRGYTGAQFPGVVVTQFFEANDYNLARIEPLVAHEFHHIMRGALFPWDMMRTSVADYMVMEGLAESFATARYGEELVGYYVSDLDQAQLATARDIIGGALDKAGFNVIRGYIFGDQLADQFGFEKTGLPPFGGYAIGYHVVQGYLERTGQSIEEATLVTADEIVRASGYFE